MVRQLRTADLHHRRPPDRGPSWATCSCSAATSSSRSTPPARPRARDLAGRRSERGGRDHDDRGLDPDPRALFGWLFAPAPLREGEERQELLDLAAARGVELSADTRRAGGGRRARGRAAAAHRIGLVAFRLANLNDLERIRVGDLTWLPLRRVLGVTGFGVAAWTAAAAGDPLIERHDETTTGTGDPHEELYVVIAGRATFTVAGEEHDAPEGACLLVEVGTMREAVAAEPGTTVLAMGGKPGAGAAGLALRALLRRAAGLRGRRLRSRRRDRERRARRLARSPARALPAGLLPRARRAPRRGAALAGDRLRGRRAHARVGGEDEDLAALRA